MQIYLTFDYELYFGERTGTVEKCITGPTAMLTEMADRQGIKLCQFVDIGFLIKLEEAITKYPHLQQDYTLISRQLEQLHKTGHDLQLHIHPHWEDSYYDGNQWHCRVNRYKLSDFNDQEIADIVHRYKTALSKYCDPAQLTAFRAGGWCIQPFERFKDAFRANGITTDSSVFANGYYESAQYAYDFRGAPLKSKYHFSTDPVIEDPEGIFTEIPISSIYNSPLFYWRLFLLGRLNPHQHKPLGDGVPISAPGQRFSLLTRWTHNTVSVDGYNASLLNRAYRQHKRRKQEQMVIIGHPKSLTRYGLKALEQFVEKRKADNQFVTFKNPQ
jgi:hypothetical protein